MDKLEQGAEDAEASAGWSAVMAVAAIDAADLTALQAIAARLDLEMAADDMSRRGRG